MLGPPGAGKGTQASIISERFGIPHISTGDIFREMARRDDELAAEVRSYMERGLLVPDDLVDRIVEERISREDCSRGFVLDGYPRNLHQAEALDSMLADRGWSLSAVLDVEVDDEEVVRRITSRRVCESCGAVYNLLTNPPARPGVCDRCGGRLIQRDDDREEVVRERLRVYREQTAPLIDYYGERGILRVVDGVGSVEEVAQRVARILEGLRGAGDPG